MNQNQIDGIELILMGLSEKEIAEKIGVSRQTINNWRNKDADFISELNLRREALWSESIDAFRQLPKTALEIISNDLKSNNEKIRRNAAFFIIKQINLREFCEPKGDTNPKKVRFQQLMDNNY